MTDTTKTTAGRYTAAGRPHLSTSLTPHITVSPARGAVDFYREAFGAVVEDVTEAGGLVLHAQLRFSLGRLTLSDPLESYGLRAPGAADAASYSLALYVPAVDAVFSRAVELGATVREPLADFVSGDRYASIVDPFGVRWTVMTRVQDISDTESFKRVRAWAAGQTQQR